MRIPAEWEPHSWCWMSWGLHYELGSALDKIKGELSTVIRTIAEDEPVKLLAPPGDGFREANDLFSSGQNVEVLEAPVDDIWMRDIVPTFALRQGSDGEEAVAIDWNFNGWGNTQHRRARPGDRLARVARTLFGTHVINAGFIAEGGAFVTDGAGTIITTRSCLLNTNRNPKRTRNEREQMIENDLRERLGARKVVWLAGDQTEKITSGHVDGYVLPAPNNILLVEQIDDGIAPRARETDAQTLAQIVDANDKPFLVRRVLAPRETALPEEKSDFFASCYLNAHVTEKSVITARFGDDERDEKAKEALEKAFFPRKIRMLRIDSIANEGGGIHCLTQPMPLINSKSAVQSLVDSY